MLSEMTVSVGARVSFLAKTGRRIEGIYLGDERVPWAGGSRLVHVVRAEAPFGEGGPRDVECIIEASARALSAA